MFGDGTHEGHSGYWRAQGERAYQELSGHEDHDSLALQGGLGIQRRDGVLHLLEWKILGRRYERKYAARTTMWAVEIS